MGRKEGDEKAMKKEMEEIGEMKRRRGDKEGDEIKKEITKKMKKKIEKVMKKMREAG